MILQDVWSSPSSQAGDTAWYLVFAKSKASSLQWNNRRLIGRNSHMVQFEKRKIEVSAISKEQSGHHIDIAKQPSITNGIASSASSAFTAQIDAAAQNAAEKIFVEL
ncbi:uncharacterized protein LOC120672919 [Panicum virgatum]|uniref:uncharacterized protein LOC120672919 n=1 Tax=Panicum virgatum TaxID=38727 RepID=UPI0019D680B3|nr:uncharacterized protein LOC120672919 [Panicum virgatum]